MKIEILGQCSISEERIQEAHQNCLKYLETGKVASAMLEVALLREAIVERDGVIQELLSKLFDDDW